MTLSELILKAQSSGRCIAFLYRKEGESKPRARVVAPVRIEHGLLLAEDLHRGAPRSFMVDKIEFPQLGEKYERIGPFEDSEPPVVDIAVES